MEWLNRIFDFMYFDFKNLLVDESLSICSGIRCSFFL